ncbi:MAG: ATP-binding protein [Solirubrobacteraceae bacterium]|nr:ATP-binding protein [Solirubrobacteraceae bacterium]
MELEPPGEIARVSWVADDGLTFGLEYKASRQAATGSARTPVDFAVGDVVLVDLDSSAAVRKVSNRFWPDSTMVGVVRAVLDDRLIVDLRGDWRLLTKPPFTCVKGNTVEVAASGHVVRVLTDGPLRLADDLDGPEDLGRFRVAPDATLDFNSFFGYEQVVESSRELVALSLNRADELRAIGTRPIKGVLFTGPPGTGKTWLAQILAAKAAATFYVIRGPEIVSKYVGDSEGLLRRIFEDAAKQARALIFFDEIDSVAARRGQGNHDASERLVAQFLTLMDGVDSSQNVLVVAATNRPQDIDQALRRPGRFDWEIAFPLPDENDRLAILEGSAGPMQAETLPHAAVATRTVGWTGAELVAVLQEAALVTVKDGRSMISVADYLIGFERQQRRRSGKERADA